MIAISWVYTAPATRDTAYIPIRMHISLVTSPEISAHVCPFATAASNRSNSGSMMNAGSDEMTALTTIHASATGSMTG